MELDLSPEAEKKLIDRAAQSGQTVQEFVVGVLQRHIDEIFRTETMLDGRYDELKSGKVELVPGEEVVGHFRKKSESARGLQTVS